MTKEARHFRCPEKVLGWIPWYAEGGLSARQKGQVEAHAAECSDCRAELEIVSGAPFEIDMELPDPERLFHEITARIDAGERETEAPVIALDRTHGLSGEELDRIGHWILDPSSGVGDETGGDGLGVDETPRVLRGLWSRERMWIVAAAAAALLLFLGGIEANRVSSSEPDRLAAASEAQGESAQSSDSADVLYHSATVASEGDVAESEAPMLDVVFLDSVPLRDVSDALRAVGVEIVSGPTKLGVYRVRLMSGSGDGREPTAADAAAIANRLKAPGSAVAIFAEAVP